MVLRRCSCISSITRKMQSCDLKCSWVGLQGWKVIEVMAFMTSCGLAGGME